LSIIVCLEAFTMNHRTTYITALSIVAGAALIAACSSSSTTTTTNNTGKDGGGGSGDEDGGSSGGDTDGGSSGGDTDSGSNGGMDSGGGGTPQAGQACPGPTGAQGGCDTGLECESFPSKSGNFCTKACSDPGNMTSADCANNAAFTGKCTPNSYCQLK